MSTQKVRIGIVGMGNIGREHLEYLPRVEGVSVVAVCDNHAEACKASGSHTKVIEFRDYLAMLESGEVDVVLVCTPHNTHAEITMEAAHRGVHVFKEKPLARTLSEAQILIRAVQDCRIQLGVAAQRRFHPTYSRARDSLDMLGTVFLIRAVHVFESEPVDFGWRGDKAVAGGGAILDTAYHMIDLLCLYFGPPTEIYAKQAMIARPEVKYDTEDSAVLVFSYASGMMGSLLVSRAALPREEQITIFGTKGTLSVTRTEVNVVDKQGNILQHFTAARSWELALNSQFADFAACVQSGNVPKSSAQTHLTTMRFIEAAYSSVEHRMPVVTELS